MPWRIAVVGAGAIGRRHIELIGASADCRLAAVVDPSAGGREAARQAGVAHHASLDRLLAGDRPDGVIIATPNHLHLEQALACIEAGAAVLIEKPIAASVAEAEQLCRFADARRARVLIGHHRAHSPLLEAARAVVRDGRLGRIVAVTGSALFHKPDSYFGEAPWRAEPGGGPILINLIHEIGNLRGLCGEIVSVQAFASNAVRGLPVEDTAAILLRFESGALGTFMLSDTAASASSWEQTSRENAAYAASDDEDCYRVIGTHRSLGIPTLRLRRFSDGGHRSWFEPLHDSVVPVTRADPLARQLAHFCDVMRGAAEPLVSARDGLQNLRVVEAVARAARDGGRVDIAPPG